MSIVGLIMNLLLTGLLVAALVVGFRLNRRLKVLRDSHDGFEAAVRDLNLAAARAEQGLADLRAATDEATDLLADRIEKGRTLAARLERHTDKLEKLSASAPPLRRAEPDAQHRRPQHRRGCGGRLRHLPRECAVRRHAREHGDRRGRFAPDRLGQESPAER